MPPRLLESDQGLCTALDLSDHVVDIVAQELDFSLRVATVAEYEPVVEAALEAVLQGLGPMHQCIEIVRTVGGRVT